MKRKWSAELTKRFEKEVDALIGQLKFFSETWAEIARQHQRPWGDDGSAISDKEMDLADFLDSFMSGSFVLEDE